MHIGFYLDEWREGGVPAFILRALRGLDAMGDTTTLFLARPHPKREAGARQLYEDVRQELGGRCVSLDLPSYPPRWSESHLAQTIAASGVQCLFASQFRAQKSALAALSRHLPVAGIAHNDLDYYYHEYLVTQAFLAAEVAVSAAVFETCLRYTPPSQQTRVFHIPYGAETTDVPEQPLPATLGVIYCSRLDPTQKRSLDLPAIWKSFLEQGGKGTLTVIGSGKALPALRLALASEITAGSVRFLGQLTEPEVYRTMATGDVILNLSNFEGLPQTILEGTSLGLWPLLSDTRSGHGEIVRALGHGTICPIGDIPGFARELLGLAGQLADLRHQRIARATRARETYSQQKCHLAYHDLAERLARNFSLRAPPAPHRPRLAERLHRSFLLANYRRHMH